MAFSNACPADMSPDFATPALTVRPGPGQERFPWSTPSVVEVFFPPDEVAALWKLPPVIECRAGAT
jgi:hypothetical protein